ncbi:MAG: polysaccharide biosynthesis/export family protein [Deltaproteobacteria bacterium]|nr:polysaccharide biosynthesis/export family protein [Deltaproteobacteria bacterium]
MRTSKNLIFFCAFCLFWVIGTAGLQAEDTYLLGPEDLLEISVWKDTELTREIIVQPDGYFSFPLAGQILAGGRSIAAIQKELNQKLSSYVPDPTVTVLLRKVQSYAVYVVGKVNRPGHFVLGRKVNVMQALSMAGGLTPFASSGNILILREGAEKQEKYQFDYDDIANGKNLDQNIDLKSGDVVVVP